MFEYKDGHWTWIDETEESDTDSGKFDDIIPFAILTVTGIIGLGFVGFMISDFGANYLCEKSLFKAFWQTQYYKWPKTL